VPVGNSPLPVGTIANRPPRRAITCPPFAAEIVENLEAALNRFRKVALSLQPG
jgi:hypothetical protein